MQLDGSAESTRPKAQSVSLRAAPCPPFDNHLCSQLEQLLGKRPLQFLDLGTAWFIPQVDIEGVHPLVGREPNGGEPRFQ